ncbi:two-component sensor histidine kinase [Vibrio sp. vnigr-6D03]|uniref:ATP-binding protein n=1 Tax=Vibrio sp. vnigr-6D03 TaxID=2058088 RepID=UPI000C32AF9B|nr:ATP-binding protein [Vibrio sp. vnigr-6D03]PKF78969.1 two-component sensor histidine kinase [Vibrio sp. vnigr-6D03]
MIKAFSLLWLVILIPIALFFSPFSANPLNHISNILTKDFYEDIYGPTLYTLQEDLDAIPSENWSQYIKELQPHFGVDLKIVEIADFPLGDTDLLSSLKAGEIVYHISDPPALLMRIHQSEQAIYFATDLASNDYGRMQAKGPMYILTREIKKTPKDQREVELEKITQQMPVYATIEPLDSLELSEENVSLLLSGEITSELSEEGGLVLFAQIEGNDILRVMDSQSSTIQIQFMGAIIMGIMLCIAAVIVLWAIPLWRDLKRLVATANQYGKGDLQARAKTSRMSVVAKLSTSFNNMADSVEKLILGHRELTNAIAHDLRTPLYRLRFAFEMLNGDITTEQREKYNNVVEKSIDDLDHLINQTLILSRYSRRVPNAKQIVPCVLEPILRAEIHHFQLEHADLQVEFNCSSLLQEEEIMVDQRAMVRAMNNLLSNAARFAKSTIVVTFERHPKTWQLTIEDDGIGIPQALWESIFDPFTQVDNEERDTTTGHGLGLAIVKQIAIWHEGDVLISQSSLGGAKFILSWNAKPEEDQQGSRAKVVTNGHS